jgi:hypothetical protein
MIGRHLTRRRESSPRSMRNRWRMGWILPNKTIDMVIVMGGQDSDDMRGGGQTQG